MARGPAWTAHEGGGGALAPTLGGPTSTPAVALLARPRPPATARIREGLAGTPGTMRVFNVVCMLAALAFGAVGALAVTSRSDAIADIQASAEQLVRVQSIRTDLVEADAAATNAFLKGGLEPPAQRTAYERNLAAAAQSIAEASAASEADAAALGAVNDRLVTYAGLIEAARANNRQGYPVGAAYLRQAHVLLDDTLTDPAARTDVMTDLGVIVAADQARVDQAYRDSEGALASLWIAAGVTILPMLVAQGWLFVRTRRWVNVGVAVAMLVMLGAAGMAGAVMAAGQTTANTVRTRSYAATVAVAQARTELFEARSAESLTLIARGSGAPYEQSFVQSVERANAQLSAARSASAASDPTSRALTDYRQAHAQIRAADDAGDWDRAVALATDDGGQAKAAFATFDELSATLLEQSSQQVSASLTDARRPLDIVRWVVAGCGAVAMVAASMGFARRLKEYR